MRLGTKIGQEEQQVRHIDHPIAIDVTFGGT